MRIAVLPPFPDGSSTAIENYLQIQAVRQLLDEHELVRVNAATEESFDVYICLGDRFLSDGFWDRWILGEPKKVIALGVAVDPTLTWDARATEKLRAVAKKGAICAVDEVSFKKIKEAVANGVCLGGSPALFSSCSPLQSHGAVRIFQPTVFDPAFRGKHFSILRRLSRRFFRRLNHKERALLMIHAPAEFEMGALAGSHTLFEPLHPQMHAKAIASAYALYGFHSTALMTAVANGVPAVLLGNEPIARNAVQSAGIPFLELTPNTDPAELEHRCEEIVRKYPWETVKDKSGVLRANLIAKLKELGLRPRETKRRSGKLADAKQDSALHFATLVDKEELATFVGLHENLAECAGTEVHHHVLALDRASEVALQKVYSGRNVHLYRPSEIWKERDITALLAPLRIRRSLLKPRFLSMLLTKCKGPVIGVDANLWFYQSPADLLKEMDGGHSLFFPRWSDAMTEPEAPSLYDTSLVVTSPGGEGLLDWWSSVALAAAKRVPASALPPENGFLGRAPILFPGARIYRAADQNIRREAFHSLGIQPGLWDGDPIRIGDGRSALSLRWSEQDAYGYLGVKGVWDQISHLYSELPRLAPGGVLREAVLRQQGVHWGDLQRCLKAVGLRDRHLPWLAGPASDGFLKYFVSGWGRRLGRAVGRMIHVGKRRRTEAPVFPPIGVAHSPWIAEHQKRLFGSARLTSHADAPSSNPELAASA